MASSRVTQNLRQAALTDKLVTCPIIRPPQYQIHPNTVNLMRLQGNLTHSSAISLLPSTNFVMTALLKILAWRLGSSKVRLTVIQHLSSTALMTLPYKLASMATWVSYAKKNIYLYIYNIIYRYIYCIS